jgi:hypothetical protein
VHFLTSVGAELVRTHAEHGRLPVMLITRFWEPVGFAAIGMHRRGRGNGGIIRSPSRASTLYPTPGEQFSSLARCELLGG